MNLLVPSLFSSEDLVSILCTFDKDCSSKFRSKHSTGLILSLLRNLLEQPLVFENGVKNKQAAAYIMARVRNAN